MRHSNSISARPLTRTLAQVVAICVASLVASVPLFLYGFPYGHDSVEHLCWYTAFARQFWSGEIYPRWLLDANAGLGSPIFFVFGPLPYWVACLFRPAVEVFVGGGSPVRELGLSAALALVISGLAAYLWLREAVGPRSALPGAILFLFVPYHLTVDLYVRGALAEFWAFAWMPLILWFTARLLHRKRYAVAGFGTSYALLIFTHLFTALLFTPVPVVIALFSHSERDRRKILLRLGAGMALGIALSAVYLLPATRNEKYISAQRLIEERPNMYYYGHNFMFSEQTTDLDAGTRRFRRYLSWLTVATAMTAAFACAGIAASPTTQYRRKAVVWAGIAAAAFFLMLSPSRFVWAALPVLQRIQFPWRLNTVFSIAIVALLALMIECFGGQRRKSAAVAICGVSLLSTLPWFAASPWAAHRASPWASPGLLNPERASVLLAMDSDYLTPVWMRVPSLASPESIRRLAAQFGNRNVLPVGDSAVIEHWGARELRLRTKLNSAQYILVKRFYYPGWRAEASNRGPIPLGCSREGLITVEAPSGETILTISLPPDRAERYGLWITLAATLLASCAVAASFKMKKTG